MNEVILKSEQPLAVYSEFRKQLEVLKSENAKTVFDYSTKNGEHEARSYIFKLRKTKAAVEKARKAEKAESLRYGRVIDSEAKEIQSEIGGMIEVHARPLREIEEQEEKRIQKHKDAIECMKKAGEQTETSDGEKLNASSLNKIIDWLSTVDPDESFEEFKEEAIKTRDEALTAVRGRHQSQIKYEAEQKELAMLREEAEERAARDAAEAQAKATKEREDFLRKEGEERGKKEAEQRAIQAVKDAEEKAKMEVKEKAKAEADAAVKREANKRHVAKINNEILDALIDNGINQETAKDTIKLIALGKIPHVRISY